MPPGADFASSVGRDDPANHVSTQASNPATALEKTPAGGHVTNLSSKYTGQEADDITDMPVTDGDDPAQSQPSKPKKKKKSKNKSRSAKKKATGFEEYYCDPPVTPEQHEEERCLYDQANSFPSRIEQCIQRYRARRRLDNDQDNLFSKYLMLGGIDATVRQFQSTRDIDDETIEESTKAELREMAADDVIQRGSSDPRFFNPNDDDHWVVDFAGVASGFISVRLLTMVGTHLDYVQKGINVVLNFLKYVELHDVCPEYALDIKHAQEVCSTAKEEVPAVLSLTEDLPGEFNRAARSLFCRSDEKLAAFEFDNERNYMPMSQKQAKAVFFAAIVAWKAPEFCNEMLHTNVQIEFTLEQVFEVLPLEEEWLPNSTTLERYRRIRNEQGKTGSIDPTGSIFLRPSLVRDGWDNGQDDFEVQNVSVFGQKAQFFLEHKIISRLKPGMKLRMVVCKLTTGLLFIKEVKQVYPTFYVFLPQELMMTFKEPVFSDRPAPSVDNPERVEGDDHEV